MPENASVLGSPGSSDVLARCESLQSDTAALTSPSETELPSDVATTLSTSSSSSWSDLDDVAKVGLLWAHGYVFSGGSSNGGEAGDALVQVYTRCSEGSATGAAMADVGVSYDDFTGSGSRCEAASCGSYYQATNANCVANVTSAIQCAVDGGSSQLPTAKGVSFWSSVTSSSTIPYPQAYEHSITLSDATALQVYSIHMRNNDAGVSCGNTLDTIVPCLRLEDVATSETTSTSGASGWCKPTVDADKVKSFLAAVSTVQVNKQSDETETVDEGSEEGAER
ncbi:TKL protein kinase [Phytophthora cinnamomi]|uniref:TKL protein kinase n=1 Tax=Phytophthora cinnamomi TaxID=4785 RepID=UPI0035596F44|nr:TKL protein kinase [Phytophthora cinnamomi]